MGCQDDNIALVPPWYVNYSPSAHASLTLLTNHLGAMMFNTLAKCDGQPFLLEDGHGGTTVNIEVRTVSWHTYFELSPPCNLISFLGDRPNDPCV